MKSLLKEAIRAATILGVVFILGGCRTISCASDGLNNTIQALVLDTQDAVQVTSK